MVSRGRLLVAEDHEGVLNSVLRLLSKHYDVIGTVKDGRALLEAAGAMEPDVLVVDISMPVLNGLEAARILRQTGCKSKIVFLTAHDDADFISAAQDAGGVGYVLKQQMATDLPAAVKLALAGKTFISSSSVAVRPPK